MRIVGVTAYHVCIPFKAAFGHALYVRREAESIVIEIATDAGETGVGEILPRPYLTGETIASVLQDALPRLVHRWMGCTFKHRDEVVERLRRDVKMAGRALATFAGWESAALDLAGRHFGFAAGDVLGPVEGPTLPGGVVIDFDIPTEKLEKHSQLLRLTGKRHVKLKVGRANDLQRLEIVAGVLGPDLPLRIDANAAWTPDDAIAHLRHMRAFNIRSVEQPVAAHDLDGMRRVRARTGIPIVADESLCTLDDARRLIATSAADIFNIRIAKCGGLLASAELAHIAKENGLAAQLGTLVGETGILLRSAELFSRRIKGFEFLEGKDQNNRLLVQDVLQPQYPGGGRCRNGLGIEVSRTNLTRWMVSPALAFHYSAWSVA